MKRSTSVGIALCFLLGVTEAADAKPIVYTLYSESNSVSSVQLNGNTLSGLIKLQFKSDTSSTTQAQENGVTVWRNDNGDAWVTISQGSQKTVAHILPNQVYVRYDPTNGVVGFGSYASGIGYPLTLNCQGYQCNGYVGGTVGGLVDINTNSATNYAPDVAGLATHLLAPALLTGFVSYCVGSTAASCTSPAAPIQTDLGPLRIFAGSRNVGSGVFTAVVVEQGDGGGDD